MNTTYRTIIFAMIIALPIIDILTTFTENWSVSIGAFIRGILILILFNLLVIHFWHRSIIEISAFLLPFILVAVSFLINLYTKRPFFLFDEIQFHVKTIYFLLMIFFALIVQPFPECRPIVEQRRVQPSVDLTTLFHATGIAATVIGISYWIAFFTATSLSSYSYDKSGYSGWFFAANELSVIIIILFTFAIIHFTERPSWLTFVPFGILLSIAPYIGTKTAFFGVLIMLASVSLLYMVTSQWKKIILMLMSIVILGFILPGSPIANNISPQQLDDQHRTEPINEKKIDQVLSSRDTYFQETKTDFLAASPIRKLFGLGYAGDYEKNPKTIEMDGYDLFFSYGVIGGAVILLPFILLTKNLMRFSPSSTYVLLFTTYLLCIGIAFFVGHVIFAPAVMSYVAVLLVALRIEQKAAMHHG